MQIPPSPKIWSFWWCGKSLWDFSFSPLLSLRIKSQTPNLVVHPPWVEPSLSLASSAFFSWPSAAALPFLSALLARSLCSLMCHYFRDPLSAHPTCSNSRLTVETPPNSRLLARGSWAQTVISNPVRCSPRKLGASSGCVWLRDWQTIFPHLPVCRVRASLSQSLATPPNICSQDPVWVRSWDCDKYTHSCPIFGFLTWRKLSRVAPGSMCCTQLSGWFSGMIDFDK